MKYKAGDKVMVARPTQPTARTDEYQGFRGVIYSVNSHITAPYPYGVKLHVNGRAKFLNMAEDELMFAAGSIADSGSSTVDHPAHYTWLPNGIEVIDIAEHLNFNRGNAVKYISRAGRKATSAELEDLRKARWYVEREIQRVEKRDGTSS
ncbi:DUF3310 domain-containing protein [Streptomyces sp. NBC_00885]|uniref:DUF3310 domain-containing protein n=1 Tax=Streptomyces sp. NBC_00885 TaxID=2975857 RepID=UPI00386D2213|nr:DUF3310 domain-containing protein [Streptomyces sp. NBC_00885]